MLQYHKEVLHIIAVAFRKLANNDIINTGGDIDCALLAKVDCLKCWENKQHIGNKDMKKMIMAFDFEVCLNAMTWKFSVLKFMKGGVY